MNSTPDDADENESKRTPDDYLHSVWVGERRHLLVEGPDDRALLRRLFELVDPSYKRRVNIDVANDHLKGVKTHGARALVMRTCELAAAHPVGSRVVGFVDREYDDFQFEPAIVDQCPTHVRDLCLLRARGHSIENYLFHPDPFFEQMRAFIPEDVPAARALLACVFPDALRIACTIGLCCRLNRIGNHSQMIQDRPVRWQHLILDANGRMRLDFENWVRDLPNDRKPLPVGWADELARMYRPIFERAEQADLAVVRWVCHGHIGLSVLWSAVVRCVYECVPPPEDARMKRANRVLSLEREFRLLIRR